jgi:HK97 family phage major capsid protein
MLADYDKVAKRADELYRATQDAAAADAQRAEYEGVVRSTPAPAGAEQTDDDKLRAFLRGETRSVEFRMTPEHRIHTKVTAASGGTTVPRDFVGTLYDYLYESSPIRQLARVITTSNGQNLDFPVVASQGTAAIVGEGTALAGTDASFTTVTLGAWKYGKLTQLSNELVTDTGVDLVDWIAMDAGRAIAQAQGEDFSLGTGTNEPKGYGTAYSIGKTGATGGTGVPSIANLIDLFYSVLSPYRNSPKCAWVAEDASWAYVRKLAVASTAPEGTWATNLQAGQPDLLLGKPVYADQFAASYGTPAKPISFGDWSTYLIRDVGTVRMERSDDFAFDKDLITFRTAMRTDANTIDVRGVKHFAGPST